MLQFAVSFMGEKGVVVMDTPVRELLVRQSHIFGLLSDNEWHSLAELYENFGHLITPQQAKRDYDKEGGSKTMELDAQVYLGRHIFLNHRMRGYKRLDLVIFETRTDNYGIKEVWYKQVQSFG